MYFGRLKWLSEVNTPEVFFILRLRRMGVITWEEKDIEFAKFYGIPKCCRDFYITLGRIGISQFRFMTERFGVDTERSYVRCPKCRMKGGVTNGRGNKSKMAPAQEDA